MRGLTILAMLAGTLAHAAFNDYIEVRDLALDTGGIDSLEIDTGAGPLVVTGVPGADRITVTATITVPGRSEDEAREILEDGLQLRLEQDGSGALLESHFDDGRWIRGNSPEIELEVNLPQRLAVMIEDGSGRIDVRNVGGAIQIDDGSGSLHLAGAGSTVDVDDGSGSIEIDGAGGDVRIVDGSGSIDIRQVAGSVYIDDGSGSITVDGVTMDLVVDESGSGGIDYKNVLGQVILDD